MASAAADGAGSAADAGAIGIGEKSPESGFTSVLFSPVFAAATGFSEQNETVEQERDDSSSFSSFNSPPTHPAFYSVKVPAETAKENVCSSPMTAPLSAPSAQIMARSSPSQLKTAGTAEIAMQDMFWNHGAGGEGPVIEKVPGNVDTNVTDATSNDKGNGDGQVVSLSPVPSMGESRTSS